MMRHDPLVSGSEAARYSCIGCILHNCRGYRSHNFHWKLPCMRTTLCGNCNAEVWVGWSEGNCRTKIITNTICLIWVAQGVVVPYHKAPGSSDTGAWKLALSEARPGFQRECLSGISLTTWHGALTSSSIMWSSDLPLWTFGARSSSVVGVCLMHCRMFSSITGLYPQDASSTPHPNLCNQNYP